MTQLPVIFLAFANDHEDYLYKLTEEQDAIRRALRGAAEKGLCEVVYETDTNIEKIWDTFDRYQDRISIFHYGGHANDYLLLLKEASGKRQIAHSGGLVSFLGSQKGLKLAFINGCSSKIQALEMRDQGVPAVIGTAQPINDAMATRLSGKFYESLAEGRSLEQAWQGACDFVKTLKGESGYFRGFEYDDDDDDDDKETQTVDFPWDMYIRPGSEQVKSWNLAREARNPLFNLPLPDSYFLRLRNSPFVGLHFFQEEDSALFFGRGAQIRELYNHIKGIHPIILLYGKSGVGKSSMLDAGLLPRIKGEYKSVYARRIQEKGLLGTLELALSELLGEQSVEVTESIDQREEIKSHLQAALSKTDDNALRNQIELAIKRLDRKSEQGIVQLTSILRQWQAVEQHTGKALVIILDQVEEKYTRPMPGNSSKAEDELIIFLTAIQPLFSGGETGIKGKLILSYRKEYHPEIRDTFQALSLPYAELFLKRLDRDGIIEAIQGVNKHSITKAKYNLEIEKNLPELIADDLMEDSESPIAPVLQIILEKLWKTSFQSENQPVSFSILTYQELRKQGTTMGEFFDQQMDKLTQKLPAEVASGLSLDILNQHTTNLGTAGSCRREDLLERYAVERNRLKDLINELQDLSLLVRIDQRHTEQSEDNDANYTTILAHDTLAPIVIRAYNLSDAPGQRASRILNNKLSDVGFRLSQKDKETLLAAYSLQKDTSENGININTEDELSEEYIGPANFTTMLHGWLTEDQRGTVEREMMEKAEINLQAGGREIYLAESDLAIVEQGAGLEGETLSGMQKLSAAGEQMIGFSRQKRAERIKRERAIRRRQRMFTAAISIALLIATGLGIWAVSKQREAQENANQARANLVNFQKAKAEEVKAIVNDILHREEKLRSNYPKQSNLLLQRVEDILGEESNQNNPILKPYTDSLQTRIRTQN